MNKKENLLARSMRNYINPKSNVYDFEFSKLIYDLLGPEIDFVIQNKINLLNIAKKGGDRPQRRKSILGQALVSYTAPSSESYDLIFYNKIKELAPKWFEDRTVLKKDKLLKMAKNGLSKPNWKSTLGKALIRYVNKTQTQYDKKFCIQIKLIRPSWFPYKVPNKETLLRIAVEGKDRPLYESSLGRSLGIYTQKNSSKKDIYFDKKIRKLRPDWFKK